MKVIVFDSGLGGEIIADYLEEELPIIDFVRVIDRENAPYFEHDFSEIFDLTVNALKPYLGKNDAIVLADYLPSLIINELKEAFPDEKFVGLSPDFRSFSKSRLPPKKILMIGSRALLMNKTIQNYLNASDIPEIVECECDNWDKMIDRGLFNDALVQEHLETYHSQDFDMAFLADTHLWGFLPELEQIFGWRVQLVAQKRELLRSLCRSLELLGVDGGRPI